MKTATHTLRLILVSLALASGVALRAAPASGHTPIHLQADIVYQTTAAGELHLDLFYPATELSGTYPLVVYTHGGGWAALLPA
jgi:acetyl esterase/lipase